MLLEQQNKKRLLEARQAQDNLSEQRGSAETPTKPDQQKSSGGEASVHEEEGGAQNSRGSFNGLDLGVGEVTNLSTASEASGRKSLATTYTISEDDTLPEGERQKRQLIALLPITPREERT